MKLPKIHIRQFPNAFYCGKTLNRNPGMKFSNIITKDTCKTCVEMKKVEEKFRRSNGI